MNLWTLPRLPEAEVMSKTEEVEAYASAAAQAYLDSIDNTLVEQVIALGVKNGILAPARTGASRPLRPGPFESPGKSSCVFRLLDLGTGPGGIPLKIARTYPDLGVVGVDRSLNMARAARNSAAEQGLGAQAFFLVADAGQLPFADARFDLVISNSLLHHLPDPIPVFNEMARVASSVGVVLLRDLRRPSRLAFPLHVRWFGRYYSGLMKRLYLNSLRAAYTAPELARLLRRSALATANIFFHRRTHLGFVRQRGPHGADLKSNSLN